VIQQIGPDVQDWITLNEPMVNLVEGYMVAVAPPGEKRKMADLKAPMEGMLRAHAAAYRALHDQARARGADSIRVGIAHHLRVFDPNSDSPLDAWLANSLDQVSNWSFGEAVETGHLVLSVPFEVNVDETLPEIAGTQDFIGVNYYSRDMVSFNLSAPGDIERDVNEFSPVSDAGWEIYPEGFYRVLTAAAQRFPGKPIFVTENGIADAADSQRPAFIEDHLAAMGRAIQAGAPVVGYCYWSLMDNFEWSLGFAPRFGLYQTDYSTMNRIARPSARLFAAVAAQNQLNASGEQPMYKLSSTPLSALLGFFSR
jgi:beta-glucosidase